MHTAVLHKMSLKWCGCMNDSGIAQLLAVLGTCCLLSFDSHDHFPLFNHSRQCSCLVKSIIVSLPLSPLAHALCSLASLTHLLHSLCIPPSILSVTLKTSLFLCDRTAYVCSLALSAYPSVFSVNTFPCLTAIPGWLFTSCENVSVHTLSTNRSPTVCFISSLLFLTLSLSCHPPTLLIFSLVVSPISAVVSQPCKPVWCLMWSVSWN